MTEASSSTRTGRRCCRRWSGLGAQRTRRLIGSSAISRARRDAAELRSELEQRFEKADSRRRCCAR